MPSAAEIGVILVSGFVGALFSFAVLAVKVIPHTITRRDVDTLFDKRFQPLEDRFDRDQHEQRDETKALREEISGLRTDVVRLTTTLELILATKGS
jgi:hypothetical protein